MAADLDDLYREIILDHYRSPRRKHHLEHHNREADGANPLCGDQIHVEVELEDGRIADVGFVGQGCSISQASASMMSDHVAGKTPAEALASVEAFQQMMTSGHAPEDDGFGDLEALTGVAKFPVRVKCASLGWKTLEQALRADATDTPVSTDERTTTDG
ncbi:MAG: SUF system NifU family Fe-S cluster assembly protein [Dehalococcoidia bacterium]